MSEEKIVPWDVIRRSRRHYTKDDWIYLFGPLLFVFIAQRFYFDRAKNVYEIAFIIVIIIVLSLLYIWLVPNRLPFPRKGLLHRRCLKCGWIFPVPDKETKTKCKKCGRSILSKRFSNKEYRDIRSQLKKCAECYAKVGIQDRYCMQCGTGINFEKQMKVLL